MDTSERISVETPKQITRRRRSVEEKRRIVEETLEAGASVARVARRHAVNANQVFYWRKKYREGRLGNIPSSKLLPVTLSLSEGTCGRPASWSYTVGSLEMKISKGTIRGAGNVDVVVLRPAIESLLG